MAHTEKHIEVGTDSQEAFEQMVKDRLRYAVRVALISVFEEVVTAFIGRSPMSVTKSVVISAMDITRAIWKRRSGRLLICPFHAHVVLPNAIVRALPSSSRRTG